MPPRDAGPLLTPRGRRACAALLTLALLAAWTLAAIDPSFWSAR